MGISQPSFFALLPSQRLDGPRLLLARLVGLEPLTLQRAHEPYGFGTRTQLTRLSLGHGPPQ